MKLLNAFSPSMLPNDECVCFEEISLEKAKKLLSSEKIDSSIGHEGTAKVLQSLLGLNVETKRTQVTLKDNEQSIIATINMRLPEGTVLSREDMEKIPIRWILATIKKCQ